MWRANEIVTSARAALEESVVLSAKTGFLRSGIEQEVRLLRRVRSGIEGVYKDGQKDFKVNEIILDLCKAEANGLGIECHPNSRCCECEAGIYNGGIKVDDGGSSIPTG